MFCQQCGKEIPAGSPTCPACGYFAMPRGSTHAPGSMEEAVSELKRSAKELARATALLSKRVVEKAGTAAQDPSGTAKRTTRAVAKELDKAAQEIERVLRDL
jgi:uncharacterized Zn finger protein (UPF0148 family)